MIVLGYMAEDSPQSAQDTILLLASMNREEGLGDLGRSKEVRKRIRHHRLTTTTSTPTLITVNTITTMKTIKKTNLQHRSLHYKLHNSYSSYYSKNNYRQL